MPQRITVFLNCKLNGFRVSGTKKNQRVFVTFLVVTYMTLTFDPNLINELNILMMLRHTRTTIGFELLDYGSEDAMSYFILIIGIKTILLLQ